MVNQDESDSGGANEGAHSNLAALLLQLQLLPQAGILPRAPGQDKRMSS